MRPRRLLPLLLTGAAVALVAPLPAQAPSGSPGQAPQDAVKLDADALSGLQARSIGPAVMSGRIAAIDGHLDQGRLTLYVGAASGGVWKSQNGGTTWKPVFDKHAQSIGAIRVDPSNPKTVWVGTGESWVRNSVSVGDGVYKSTDAGETWTRMGLPDSERIAGIVVDPTDGNTVYVAAMGHLWSGGGERGLYKTTDGGKTWSRVLHSNEDSGCAAVAMDPKDPKVLYATLWQHRRRPWAFESGGPGGGLFKSTDGGATWTKLNGDPRRGLPTGEVGRIAVAVAPSDPKHVYAVVEAKDGAIFHSADGGETWTRGNAGPNITVRPFYFSLVLVDPKDPMKVYKPGFELSASEDGGKSFATIAQATHSDHHALFFHPQNPEVMYLGTDGGVFVSEDRGNKWRMVPNLPVGQFYHVSVDMARPYHVYGGLQDNSSWRGSSSVNLSNKHWTNLYGGDGFWVFPDPTDPRYVYAESQGGEIGRVDTLTMTSRNVQPQAAAGEPKYRWSWNTPIHMSPNEPGTLYTGAQYLFRSRDKGATWERLGGDLTTNDPKKQQQEESGGLTIDNSAAETHCTLNSISESPRNGKVLWVGTDDGNLQVSRDGGKSWTNVAAHATGVPRGTTVSWVEAGMFAEGTAFAAFDGHAGGDMKTYVLRTDDFGKTWTSLATPELQGYAHVIKQDPVKPDLLYLGTEAGLFVSVDGGKAWAQFKGSDMPAVAVRDLAIHPREHDLVLATHGRGLWIIDDLTALRALTPQTLQKDVALLPTRPNAKLDMASDGWMEGDAVYEGQDRPGGAAIAYWQRKRHLVGDLRVEILGAKGEVLQTLSGNKRRGFNRIYWNRLMQAPRAATGANLFDGFIGAGPEVLEGTYTVRLTKNKEVLTAPLVIEADPQSPWTRKDREAKFGTGMAMFAMVEDLAFRAQQVLDLKAGIAERLARAPEAALQGRLQALAGEAEKVRGVLVSTKEAGGAITGEERLREKLAKLYNRVLFQPGPPSPSQLDRVAALKAELATAFADVDRLGGKGLAELNAELRKAGLEPLALLDRAAWDARTKK
ncbi:MAG: hypothetical protein U0P81_11305 [Holophagaceae bacterium]